MNARPLSVVLLVALILGGCAGLGGKSDATVTAPVATSVSATATATATDASTTSGSSGTAAATAPEATAPGATAAATAPAASPTVSTEGLAGQFAKIEQRVVGLRELEPTGPIAPTLISRQELHDNLVRLQTDQYSQEEARQDADVLWLLRLIDDRNLDLFNLSIDLLTERVLGYYDPETKELYVVNDEPSLSPLGEMTVAHEMVHALQDQHTDLLRLTGDEVDGDRALAHSALIEGDAEVTATRYVLQYFDRAKLLDLTTESNSGSSDVLDRAPAYIRDSLYFPYVEGVAFATQLYQLRGAEGQTAALADPPTSTEQILHPEKYLDERDEPLTVAMPDISAALGNGWKQSEPDTIGEFDLRVLLRENGAQDADGAAAGWGGGSYALYGSPDDAGGGTLIVVSTVWDTGADADEYLAALGQTFGVDDPTSHVIGDDQGRYSVVIRAGASVTLITGTDRDAVERAHQALATQAS